jgi:hypothetical protein
LGWESARDEDAIRKEDLRTRFAENVVDDPLFKRQKRLNELFDLCKSYNIHKEMTPQQVLMWCNSLLKDFSLQIRADKETYYLELQNDLLELIKRKNGIGKIYFDGKNLLKQGASQPQEDLFVDDDPPQPQQQEEEPPVEDAPPVEEPLVEEPVVAPPALTLEQEFEEYKSWSEMYDMTLSEYIREKEWKQKMELYDTSLLDVIL